MCGFSPEMLANMLTEDGRPAFSVLDQNEDNDISEQEYQRGQAASIANENSGETDPLGDAYNNRNTFLSDFTDQFGALPNGQSRQPAPSGDQYVSPTESSGAAELLQMGGMPSLLTRGLIDMGRNMTRSSDIGQRVNSAYSGFDLSPAVRAGIISPVQDRSNGPAVPMGLGMYKPEQRASMRPVQQMGGTGMYDEPMPNQMASVGVDISINPMFKAYSTGNGNLIKIVSPNGGVSYMQKADAIADDIIE